MYLCKECKFLDGVCTNDQSPIFDTDPSFLTDIDPDKTPIENGWDMLGELEREDIRELQVCFAPKTDTASS